ncbi:UNVERIFIED_CONTAM: hypothetical protein Slati_1336500 [Sesamum latifolium]|uniref:Retrotransposon gag domain-containing protein n=1 Tax=Sesamum latifolium TaxID=2727402 RepID=A0AAW2XKC0_9LAMI
MPPADRRQGAPQSAPHEVPPQWLARFGCLQKGLQEVQHQIGGAPDDEIQGVPFSEEIMADELPLNWKEPNLPKYDGTTDPQEHLSCFENIALLHRYTASQVPCIREHLHTIGPTVVQSIALGFIRSFEEFRSLFLNHFASSKRCQKIILSLFSLQQREGESVKEYLQRFNLAALEASPQKISLPRGRLPLAARTPCGRALADKTPCSSNLLGQKDSLLTKESSVIKTPPKLGNKFQQYLTEDKISLCPILTNFPENRGYGQTPVGRGHPPPSKYSHRVLQVAESFRSWSLVWWRGLRVTYALMCWASGLNGPPSLWAFLFKVALSGPCQGGGHRALAGWTSDESIQFVGESNPGEDPSEANSRMVGSQSVGPSSGQRQSLRRMAVNYRRLIDEEEEEIEGDASSPEMKKIITGPTPVRPSSSVHLDPSSLQTSHITQMREEFFIPDSQLSILLVPRLVLLFLMPTVFFLSCPTDIMFNKYFHEFSDKEREKGGNTPPLILPEGPCLQCLQGKKAYVSPGGSPSEGPAKRTRASSTGLLLRSSFTQEEGETSLAISLMWGVVTPEDRRLLAPLGREDLERKAALHLLKGMAACDTVFSRYQGMPPAVSGETSAQKMEEKIQRLERRMPS